MAGQNPGTANLDQFDAYFRRADLDGDGRISGAEAVSFFEGSNLPKNVLAQEGHCWSESSKSMEVGSKIGHSENEKDGEKMEAQNVEIKVLLFARARDVAGMGEIRLEVAFGSTTLDCVNKIFTTFPGLEEIRECMVLALNEEYTSFSTIVQNRDELAIIPPISGG